MTEYKERSFINPDVKEFDIFFKENMIPRKDNSWNYKSYKNLTESEKINVSEKISLKVLEQIKKKYKPADYKEFEKTKGDFRKFFKYKLIKDYIKTISKVKSDNKDFNMALDTIRYSIANLESNVKIFQEGFSKNNFAIIIIYDTIALSIVNGLCLLSNEVIYSKDNFRNLTINISKKSNLMKNSTFTKMSEFNSLCSKNKFQNYSKNLLNEALELVIVGTVIGVSVLLFIARRIVYKFYNIKANIYDMLENLEDELQLNLNVLQGNYNKNQDIIKKQEKYLEKIHKFKERFRVDDIVAENESEKDETDDDIDISRDIDQNHSNDTEISTSGDNDIFI